MNYDALDIAYYIINKCQELNAPISNLKLQHMLYHIQETFFKYRKKFFFWNDIEAWQFGAVVPEVYYKFCGYGAMPLTQNKNNIITLTKDETEIIDYIINDLINLEPWDVVRKVYPQNCPWEIVYNKGKGNKEIIHLEKFYV